MKKVHTGVFWLGTEEIEIIRRFGDQRKIYTGAILAERVASVEDQRTTDRMVRCQEEVHWRFTLECFAQRRSGAVWLRITHRIVR